LGELPTPLPPPATDLRVLADRYRLEDRLAAGGMADVWLATDAVLDRRVAVKILKPSLATDPGLVERFRREAIAAARLSHPSIVAVYDTVSEPGCEAVVMELIHGRTLRACLDAETRLSVANTVHIGVAVADALTVAHRARIIHRDIKPGNILIDDEGRVLLTDFGIAKALSEPIDQTRDDVMLGTAKYLSPEQVLGLPVDSRSDLYSLGVVLFECLAGQPPFVGESDAQTAMARLQRDPVPLRKLRPGVPRQLDDLVMQLLSRDADDRPRNAALLRDALARIAPTDEDADVTTVVPREVPAAAARRGSGVDGTDPTDPGGFVVPPRGRRFRGPIAVVCAIALGVGISGALLAQTGPGARLLQSAKEAITGDNPPAKAAATPTTVASAPPTIASAAEFDPPPLGDGHENPAELPNLVDHNPQTTWSTVCYTERNMAPKPGVGLVFQLSGPASGHALSVQSPTTGGWGASVYVSSTSPASLADWGAPVSGQSDLPPGEVRFGLGNSSGRYVLLFITELGDAAAPCTQRPWQLRISEVSIS
jgi:serine/threonine-protein kinase